MSAKPFLDFSAEAGLAAEPAAPAVAVSAGPTPELSLALGTPERGAERRLTIHAPMDAFGLIGELDHLARRAVDQNPFYAPQFLVPAMPRLDERRVRLMLVSDESAGRSRLRLLLPFSVEKPGLFGGAPVLRGFAHPFGRLGTPLLDGDAPAAVAADFLAGLGQPALGLPDTLVLPDMRLDGAAIGWLEGAAAARGLSTARTNPLDRAALTRAGGLPALSGRRRRELARQRRILAAEGPVTVERVAEPAALRYAFEEFLLLEASGWKGRERSALLSDRYRAAFAREAVNLMGEKGRARIFALRAGDRLAASLVVFLAGGEAVLWKIAYDEAVSRASPGVLLVAEAGAALLAEPEIARVDSCAMPDSLLVNRLWRERTAVGTLVVGLRPGMEARVARVAQALQTASRSRNAVRLMRERLAALVGR